MSLSGALGYAIMREIFSMVKEKPQPKRRYYPVSIESCLQRSKPIVRREQIFTNPDEWEGAVNELMAYFREEWKDVDEEDLKWIVCRSLSMWLDDQITTILEDIKGFTMGPHRLGKFLERMRTTRKNLEAGEYGHK